MILQHNPGFTPKVQAYLPAALAALHNVIQKFDPEEIESCIRNLELDVPDSLDELDLDELDLVTGTEGELAKGPPKQAEKENVGRRRDKIAEHMWIQYQQVLEERHEI